jgi:glutathione S-transferase
MECPVLTLYDNPFSPFARKVRMVLRFKGLQYRSIDALALDEHDRLANANPRAEVPVLVDRTVTVIDSADIVSYLEDRFPNPAVFPAGPELRAKARRWQRLADTVLDAIIHDISIWAWPTHHRSDHPPEGLIEAGRRELHKILVDLEDSMDASGFVCDQLSIADFSLLPHVSSLKPLGVVLEEAVHPKLLRWNRQMRMQAAVQEDLEYVKGSAAEKFGSGQSPYEDEKIVWRGERIEWLLAHGFQDWLFSELARGRAVVPCSYPERRPTSR